MIDRAIGEKELRNKKGQWKYKLRTLRPASGVREDDGFYGQNRKTGVGVRKG